MSEPIPPPAAPAVKPSSVSRFNLERVLVRGGIAVLLGILAIEGWAYFQMNRAHSRLLAELRKAETTDYQVTPEVVKSILGSRQPNLTKMVKLATGEERYDVYYFVGLLKTRELCVHYGVPGLKANPEVVEVTTILPDEILAP
ncbi:MAG: hypothetical protein JWN70_4433 [Planctomycetaceae bacterium]|nr:hypothetical protein [Planctomycetaceae bacterium]